MRRQVFTDWMKKVTDTQYGAKVCAEAPGVNRSSERRGCKEVDP